MKSRTSIIYNHSGIGLPLPSPEPVQSNRQRIVTVLSIGFGLAIASFAATQSTRAIPVPEPENPILTVQTVVMNLVNQYTLKRTFLGRVEAARSTDLGFELAGKILSIEVDEGDNVKQGQVLAYLDLDRLQARRKELVSALKQTRANLKLADITYLRYQQVVKSSGVSKQQLDEAKEHFRATQASVERARSRIDTIDIEIEKSRLEAPFDAYITQRRVDEGQVLAAGSPVLRLQENTSPEIRVGIAGRIVDSVQVGQVIPVVVNQLSLQASVKAIIPVRNGRTRTVDVILSLYKLPPHIRPGDLVRVELAMTIDQSGYWVPLSALSEGVRGTWSLYTLKQSSGATSSSHQTVHRRTIDIVHAESDRVFAQGFFENDDRVVTDGLQRVVPGQLVQVSTTSLAHFNANLK